MAYNIKALIVDDDDHVRGFLVVLIRRLLEGAVLEARNGLEAVKVYKAERPDLVLLDVNMPNLNGMDALRQIRKINSNAVIIMITSLATRRIVEDAADLGSVNCIRKDTSKNVIIEVIKNTIAESLVSPTGATKS